MFLFYFQSATDCVKLFFKEKKKKKSRLSYKPLPIEKCTSIFSFDLMAG